MSSDKRDEMTAKLIDEGLTYTDVYNIVEGTLKAVALVLKGVREPVKLKEGLVAHSPLCIAAPRSLNFKIYVVHDSIHNEVFESVSKVLKDSMVVVPSPTPTPNQN